MKKILLAVLLIVVFPTILYAQPTVLTAATNSATLVSTLSVACDAGSGSNRALYGFIGQRDQTVKSVTFNGDPLTSITTVTVTPTTHVFHVWYMVNPAAGSNTFEVTLSANSAQLVIACVPVEGVDQVTPHDAAVTATGSGSPLTASITSGAGDLVMGFGYTAHSGGGGTITNNQTAIVDMDSVFSGSRSVCIGSTPGDGGSKTISCTIGVAGVWGEVVLNINAAAGGSVIRHRRVVVQ